MTKPVSNRLIERLLVVLGSPDHTQDVAAYYAEIDRMTGHFPANVMDRAADRLIADGGRKWPTPKAMIDALSDAQEAIVASNSAALTKERPKWPWEVQADQSREWAERYMAIHPLAEQAKREGWSRELKGYVTSFARETLRAGHTPPEPIRYRPPHDQIAYYRSTFGGIGRATA